MVLEWLYQMLKRKERFDPREFYNMIGREFYLAIAGPSFFEHNKKLLEEIREKKSIKYDFMESDGTLLCVRERKPCTVNGYYVGDVEKAILEDGVHMPDLVPKNEVFKGYIFTLEKIINSSNSPILKGKVAEFDVRKNEVSKQLEKKVTLKLIKLPKYKSNGTIAVL